MTALAATAGWLQPVLLTALILRVTAGDADAPWLVLGALIAPLVALLVPARRPAETNPVAAVVAAIAVALVLAGDFVLAADAATLLGGAPWLGVALAAAVALLLPVLPAARRLGLPALVLAGVAMLLLLAAVALRTGATPWTAWSHGGLRAALTFSDASGWVREGERFARPARLTFIEAQRVTTLSAGVFRVTERDVVPPTVREWRLTAGEVLTLRPGDELAVEAGSRLRFEAGRRLPGAPASGIVWADAPARGPSMLPGAIGTLVTLLGGALALVPGARRHGSPAALAPLALMAAVAVAVSWGVYTAAVAPDLALGGSPLTPLLRLPLRAVGPRTGGTLALLAAGAVLLLLLAAAIALRGRLASTAGARPVYWAVTVGLAVALTAWSLDPWQLFVLGLGLAAAGWTPALHADGRTAALAGSIVGVGVFVGLSALPVAAPGVAGWLAPLTRYPALVAMPLGWAASRALGMTARPRTRAGAR